MTSSTSFPQSSKNRAPRTAILHLCPDLEPESPAREAVALATLTQRSGWRALIASAGGRLVTEAERAAVQHKRVPLNGHSLLGNLRNDLALSGFLQKERPALLHAHGARVLPYAAAVSRRHHMPLIADLTQPLADTPFTRRAITILKGAPSSVRVPSEFMGWHLHKTFGIDVKNIHLIPPGVDLNWYSAGFISAERLQKLSQLWRLPEQAFVVLMSMPMRPDLGHKLLLEAVARLKDENIFVVMAGGDREAKGMRGEIEAHIAQLGLNGKVIMPDYCHDLPAACWLSSVVVAANTEPRGQNFELLAAQAIGRPVIVSDTGANREFVLSGETAWVVPPNDAEALANALREAIKLDTAQRLNLAESTHNFIANSFPQSEWFDGMMGLYESLLQPSARAQAVA